jgi:arsenate reductase
VRSAETELAGQINPAVIAAMAEIGIDITTNTPKFLIGAAVQASDVVITMGCGDTCPYYSGWPTVTGNSTNPRRRPRNP